MKKRGYFTGWRTVFSFSLGRQLRSRVYIALTVTVALLLFAGTIALIFAVNSDYDTDSPLTEASVRRVTLSDKTNKFADASWLSGGSELFSGIEYAPAQGQAADALGELGEYDLLLVITEADGQYQIEIVKPERSGISSAELSEFSAHISIAFRAELIRRSGIDPASLSWLVAPVTTNVAKPSDIGAGGDDALRRNMSMAVSYVMIFIMYMLIMFYGQSAASSVILEKTSRLMDFFLVSVKPAAMILGKVLAAAAAALLQITVWIATLVGGIRLGVAALPRFFGSVSPEIEGILGLVSGIGAMFSPGGIAVALFMIAVGFLLYCSLAAIGGAMASKPEDLSSTNTIFSLTVVASFLLSMMAGSSGSMVSSEKWLIYFPFTAIMVTPGRAMTGEISYLEGAVSVILVAALAFLGVIVAGRIYEMMSFYRGNPPTPLKVFKMLRDGMSRKGAQNR